MSAFNKLYVLYPSWNEFEISGIITGSLVIYAEDFENFEKILKEFLEDERNYNADIKKEHENEMPYILNGTTVGEMKPNGKVSVSYFITNNKGERVGNYWFASEERIYECIMPNVDFKVIDSCVVDG